MCPLLFNKKLFTEQEYSTVILDSEFSWYEIHLILSWQKWVINEEEEACQFSFLW